MLNLVPVEILKYMKLTNAYDIIELSWTHPYLYYHICHYDTAIHSLELTDEIPKSFERLLQMKSFYKRCLHPEIGNVLYSKNKCVKYVGKVLSEKNLTKLKGIEIMMMYHCVVNPCSTVFKCKRFIWDGRDIIAILGNLKNCEKIDISHDNIDDLTLLNNMNLQRVYLSSCKQIKDLTPLTNIQEVEIHFNDNELDVECLKYSKYVTISCCPNAYNLHLLSRVKSLTFHSMFIGNIEIFKDVYRLSLYNCRWDGDESCLGNVHTLEITNCLHVNAENFQNVHTLEIINCFKVNGVQNLGNVFSLTLEACYLNDTHIENLGNNYKLDLSSNPAIRNVSHLGNVNTLSLERTSIKDVSALGNVYDLNIAQCHRIEDVSQLRDVCRLNICNCKYIYNEHLLRNKLLKKVDGSTVRFRT